MLKFLFMNQSLTSDIGTYSALGYLLSCQLSMIVHVMPLSLALLLMLLLHLLFLLFPFQPTSIAERLGAARAFAPFRGFESPLWLKVRYSHWG